MASIKIEEMRLAYVDPFPPFAYSNSGKSEGLGIEILEAALKEEGMIATYIPESLDMITRALKTGEVDGIAIYAITPERQKVYDYSGPVIQTGAGIFVTVSASPPFDLADGAGKKVCTPNKGPLTDFIRVRFPEVDLETVLDYHAALEAVARGKADGAALNFHVGAKLAQELYPGQFQMPEKMFLKTPLAVAFLKGKRDELLKGINRGLKRITKKGTRQAIMKKWFDRRE